MITLSVNNFTFEFPNEWCVIKYDECNFYRKRFGPLEDVKAVDILAIGRELLFIIEAKDFTGHRIENKKRIANQELALEIAKKIRDTVAVLYGAYRCGNKELRSCCDYLFAPNTRPIKVIFLLEEDRPPTMHKSAKRIRSDLLTAIKQRLRYLSVHCNLHNCADVSDRYGWTVRCQSQKAI